MKTPREIAIEELRRIDLKAECKRLGHKPGGTWHRAQQIALRRVIGILEDANFVEKEAAGKVTSYV